MRHACGVIVSLAWLVAAAGNAASAERAAVTVGFEGIARVGAWTPVTIRIREPSAGESQPNVFVHAEDPDGVFVRSPAATRPAGGPAAVLATTVRPGRPTGLLRIEIRGAEAGQGTAGGDSVDSVEIPSLVPSWQKLVLVIGDLPAMQRACRLLEEENGNRPRAVPVTDPSSLGRTPLDFDAADAIVICGSAVAGDTALIPEEVMAAIDGWVRDGGSLLLFSGSSAAAIAASGSIAADWLPGTFARLAPLRRTAALETFAKSTRPLEQRPASPPMVPIFESLDDSADAVVEVFEGSTPSELPLVVRRAHGFGTILWAAVEPDRPPLRDWQATDTLLSRLLERCLGRPEPPRDGEGATIDLGGQLARAIDTFEGAAPVPFGWIALLAGAYAVALYPGGWWVVERMKRRAAADATVATVAWLLLPITIGLFAAVPWAIAGRWRTDAWLESRCEVADLDAGDGRLRVHAFAGEFSPVNASFDLEASPSAAVATKGNPPFALSWFAASGQGIGATDAASPHPSLAAADYAYDGGLGRLDRIAIAAGASRLFEVRWSDMTQTFGVAGRLDRDGQAAVRGRIESRLPFPLENTILAHAGWLYDIGRFEPAGTFDPAAGKGPRSLAGSLTRRVANRERDIAARYDTADRDARRILEVAGFHAAAGGAAYTSLDAGRLGRLDLSPLLDANRAILVGTGPAATAWTRSPSTGTGMTTQAGTATLWRIVIPVGRDLGQSTPPERGP